jgi:hypothetical protein
VRKSRYMAAGMLMSTNMRPTRRTGFRASHLGVRSLADAPAIPA